MGLKTFIYGGLIMLLLILAFLILAALFTAIEDFMTDKNNKDNEDEINEK
jgi:hypothetical protein